MDEYISREAALDVIREVSERYADESLAEFAYNVVINIPAADVQPVKIQPVKQWVNLHDKHPDTEGFYLVCDQYGECEVAEYIPDIKSWFTHKIKGEIRYWMPLPKVPKDGDKANNVRNLTDEETEIYESWIDHEAKDTGVNIMDGEQNG